MPSRIDGHRAMLEERVYQIRTKCPQFAPLLTLLSDVAGEVKPGQLVVDLGRYYVYGGSCLFAPFFEHAAYVGVDCVIPNWKNVYGYQTWMVEDKRFISVPADVVAGIVAVPLRDSCADVVLIPNIVEHVEEPEAVFREMAPVAYVCGLREPLASGTGP